MANYYSSRSPPPLQHPVPTHPAFIPEPPSTPVSPQGYQRYTSSPPVNPQPQHPASSYPQFQPLRAGVPGQPAPQAPHGHGVPDFSAWGIDSTTASLGMQLGQNAVSAGQDYMQKKPGWNDPHNAPKTPLQRLKLMWRSEQGQSEFQPPRDDINSPDLYIPVMAFLTYILLAALQSGLRSHFDPEILGLTATTALFIVFADFLILRGGCYILGIQSSSPVVDLMAYCGYKFVGVIVTLIAGLLNPGRTIWTLVFLYTFFANAFFLLRSLRSVVLPDVTGAPAAVGTVSHAQRSRRITFLFVVAVTQVLYMGVLARV
ncbi:hypothetical protein EW146_g5244 [Bondarzewia mesenterica]|uniref:Protein YIF1 n=1 Tax=Bondarzewia mesenterica TaxID=1095465 RepID=A0A4S4LS23_9AGAM|nr:hypothetical protein EW146_g5244 [Bondarzewia mesenterica]